MKKLSQIAYAFACCLIPMSAYSGTIQLDYTSIQGSTVTINGSILGPGGQATAGLATFHKDNQSGVAGIFPDTLKLFCVEIQQGISVPTNNIVYDVDDLSVLPNPTSGGSLLSLSRVKAIQALYFNQFGTNNYDPATILASNDAKAAFQVAIWELANDDITGSSVAATALSGGAFSITAPSGVITLAQGFIAGVISVIDNPNVGQMSLYGLNNASVQDFLLPTDPGAIIPEPSTYALLAGVSAFGVVLLRRKVRLLA